MTPRFLRASRLSTIPFVLAGIGGRTLAQAGPWHEHGVETRSAFQDALEAVDLDGDGDADVQAGFLWYENSAGDGSSWEPHPASASDHTVASDLDRDGDQDLIWFESHAVSWTENVDGSGPGNVWHEIFGTLDVLVVTGLAVHDLDQDGDPDVVSADEANLVLRWHENTAGDAGAWTTRAITSRATAVTSLAVADVDGDGDADVFAGDSTLGYHWYENRLSAGLPWLEHFMAGTVGAARRTIRAADLDGDGDADAAVAAHWGASNTLAWLENAAGDGSSWNRHLLLSASPVRTNALATVDLDRDGDADLLRATELGLGWHENLDGTATSWRDRILFGGAQSASGPCASGDVDSDGDRDVLATRAISGTQVRLGWYENETLVTPYGSDVNPPRSLRLVSGELARDQPVVFGIDNPPGTQAPGALSFLFVSGAPAANFPAGIPIANFGMGGPGASGELLVELGPTQRLATLLGPAWNGSGDPALVPARVPGDPALVGLTFYFQGLLIDPGASLGVRFGLTNGIRATIGP